MANGSLSISMVRHRYIEGLNFSIFVVTLARFLSNVNWRLCTAYMLCLSLEKDSFLRSLVVKLFYFDGSLKISNRRKG